MISDLILMVGMAILMGGVCGATLFLVGMLMNWFLN
jgi:hypothetical protein